MISKASILTVLALSLPQIACATSGLLKGGDLTPQTLQDFVKEIKPGTIVVLGENHGFRTHQDQHLQIMRELQKNHLVSVGLEFFYYPDQPLVDLFHGEQIPESDFLKAINWGSPDFSYYRDQARIPRLQQGERLIALNAPRSLTSVVAKKGIEGLTADQALLLPPQFSPGNSQYKERFLELMPHLPSKEAGERYFLAQSIWDDTMAWKAVDFIQNHPDQVLVIVVGEFHVAYGGGLQDRIRERGHSQIVSLSQVNSQDLTEGELDTLIQPHPKYGPRADYIWVDVARP